VLGSATVGLVLALRRPENPIGWLYSAAGLAWAYPIPIGPWVDQLVREHRPLPLIAQVVVATGDLSWAPGIALGVTLPALLLPNGRLRSRRWRLVAAAAATGAVLSVVANALAPGPLEEAGIDNPLGLAGLRGEGGGGARDRRHPPALAEPATGGGLRGASVPVLAAGSSASSCAGSPPGWRPRWPGC